MNEPAGACRAIYRVLMDWPLPPGQVTDDIIAALDAAGYTIVPKAQLRPASGSGAYFDPPGDRCPTCRHNWKAAWVGRHPVAMTCPDPWHGGTP